LGRGAHAWWRRWRLWREKCQDDSETKNWLTAHTKPCPKCGKPVEKNGGCNLVMCHCRQVSGVVRAPCRMLHRMYRGVLPSRVLQEDCCREGSSCSPLLPYCC
jgi:hypothetical protein